MNIYDEGTSASSLSENPRSLPYRSLTAAKKYTIFISNRELETITICCREKFYSQGLELRQVSQYLNDLFQRIRTLELLRWDDPTAVTWLLSNLRSKTDTLILNECKFSRAVDLSSVFRSGNLKSFGYLQSDVSHFVANQILDKMAASPQQLTTLNLSFNPLGDQTIDCIARNMIKDLSLQDLQLIGCGITDVGAKALAKAIALSDSLTKLSLSDNLINDDGIILLCNAIAVTNTVSELEIGYNAYSSVGFAAIAQTTLRSPLSKLYTHGQILRSFNPEFPNILPETFWKALEQTKSLQELNLSCNYLGNSGAASIARMLGLNTSIQTLCISNAQIGDIGVTAIARALRHPKSQIKQIKLAFNPFHDDGLLQLAKALEVDESRIERIDVGCVLCNQSSTLKNLTRSLRRSKSLKEFTCQVSRSYYCSEEDDNHLNSFLELEFDYLRSSRMQRLHQDGHLKRLPLIYANLLSDQKLKYGIDLVFHSIRNKPGIFTHENSCGIKQA